MTHFVTGGSVTLPYKGTLSVDGGNGQRGLFQHVQQHANGIQSGEHGHIVLRSDAADLKAVGRICTGITGVDDIGNVTLAQGVGNLFTAIADLGQCVGTNAVFFQELGGAGGGFDVKAQVVEAADQRPLYFSNRSCYQRSKCNSSS